MGSPAFNLVLILSLMILGDIRAIISWCIVNGFMLVCSFYWLNFHVTSALHMNTLCGMSVCEGFFDAYLLWIALPTPLYVYNAGCSGLTLLSRLWSTVLFTLHFSI